MPSDVTTIADPTFVLVAWAAGLTLAVAFVSLSQIVGAGFTWLAAGVSAAIALPGALVEGAWWARTGMVFLLLGLLWARNRLLAGVFLVLAGNLLLVEVSLFSGFWPALSAAAALGGVTGEMALGHWYLVDPRLPRSALRSIALVGIAGLIADALVISVGIGLPSIGGIWSFWLLVGASVVMMVAVIAALRYPAYSGVMAATGLSYLAVLTTLGAVFLGRALVVGLGPFAT